MGNSTANPNIQQLQQVAATGQKKLVEHFSIATIKSLHHLHLFLLPYGFVVWELVTLLQKLQEVVKELPASDPDTAEAQQLVDRMAVVAASDVNLTGRNTDLLAVYRKGMDACGASSQMLATFEARLRRGEAARNVMRSIGAGAGAAQHVDNTLKLTQQRKPHLLAGVLCFAPRLPDLPQLLLKLEEFDRQFPLAMLRIRYYFEIEQLLSDQIFGPKGQRLLEILCRDDQEKWKETCDLVASASMSRAGVLTDAEQLIKSNED